MTASPPARGRVLPVGTAASARVPASSANLGPGFDSIGLALGLWDEYEAEILEGHQLKVAVSGQGFGEVPTDESHLVVRSMRHAFEVLGVTQPTGLRLVARNGVPHGRGLGSSATAIVAGVVLAQRLSSIDDAVGPLDLGVTCSIASRLEGHPDNASASVFGGLTISFTDSDLAVPDRDLPDVVADRDLPWVRTVNPPLHPGLTAVVFVPETTLATHTARAALPANVPLADAALNSARAALLVEAVTRRPDLLLPATREWLHQEQRRSAYPDSMELVDRLRAAGHAATISGAGPSVLVLTTAAGSVPEAGARWARLEPGIPPAGVQG